MTSPAGSFDRFQVVPATYVLLLRGDDPVGPGTEVLLQLRGPGIFMEHHWAAAAAGHVEYGETVYDAAVREAREELGIDLDPTDLTPLTAMQRTQPGNPDPIEQRVDYFLTARRWTGEPRILEPAKCLELGWYPLDALPDPVVPHERQVLEALAAGDVPAVVTHGF